MVDDTLRFSFTADRFGFSADTDTFSSAYLQAAEAALTHLRDTVMTLFGDPTTAFSLLGDAGLLPPRYRDWETVNGMLSFVSRVNLGLIVYSGGDLSKDEEARRIILGMRQYFAQIEQWAVVLKLGIWASLITGAGSVEASPLARRRCGLRTVGHLYQSDLADPIQSILPRLTELTQATDVRTDIKVSDNELAVVGANWASDNPSWRILFAKGKALTTSSASDFSQKPMQLASWLTQLDEDFKPFLDMRSAASGASESWFRAERDYWAQWIWSNDRAPKRADKLARVTLLDLMYTASHGGIPFLQSSTGNLSVAQWSRILSESIRRDNIPAQDVKESAASNLNVPELRSLKRAGERLDLTEPILVICPSSVQSRASAWQPQSGIRAVALASLDVLVADSQAKQRVFGGIADESDPLAEALRERAWGASIIQFIEVDNEDGSSRDVSALVNIAQPGISRFFFGLEREGRRPFIPGPRGLDDLMKIARTRYRELLPSDLEGRSFWAKFKFSWRVSWYRLLRLLRLVQRLWRTRNDEAGTPE